MLALFHIGPASCREEGLLGGVADTVEASGQSTGSDLAVTNILWALHVPGWVYWMNSQQDAWPCMNLPKSLDSSISGKHDQ